MNNFTHNRNSLITLILSLMVCVFIYVVANSSNSPNLSTATMITASIDTFRDGWMTYVPNAIIGVPIAMLWVYFGSYISADNYEEGNPKFIFIMNGFLLVTYVLTLVVFLDYIKVGMFVDYRVCASLFNSHIAFEESKTKDTIKKSGEGKSLVTFLIKNTNSG